MSSQPRKQPTADDQIESFRPQMLVGFRAGIGDLNIGSMPIQRVVDELGDVDLVINHHHRLTLYTPPQNHIQSLVYGSRRGNLVRDFQNRARLLQWPIWRVYQRVGGQRPPLQSWSIQDTSGWAWRGQSPVRRWNSERLYPRPDDCFGRC